MSENQDATSEEFKIELSGPGLSLSRQVSQAVAVQVMSVVLGGGGAGIPAPTGQTTAGAVSGSTVGTGVPQQSVGEFLAEVSPDNNPERIGAIVLYLRDQHGLKSVSKDELPEWFRRAGEAAPKNLSRDLTNAVKKSLVAEDPQAADHYFVTNTGEKKLRGRTS